MKHRPEAVTPEFMDLILANGSYQNYAQSFGTGILDHRRAIGMDEIKVNPIPLPPLDEQRAIASWAVERRSRVDTLIRKTERSIELLKEHRTALITAAVTGKIDVREAA
jgi:type I restriction enzyme S subunit